MKSLLRALFLLLSLVLVACSNSSPVTRQQPPATALQSSASTQSTTVSTPRTSTAVPTTPTSSAPLPTPAPTPLTVQAHADDALGNSALITILGGTLSATTADGAKITLTLPKDALLRDTKITLTPISRIEKFPLDGGLIAGVQIEPEGLNLLQPGTLTIELPKPLPADDLRAVSYAYEGSGQEFHLTPSKIQGQTITITVAHFSGDGLGRGTKASVQQQKIQHAPAKPQNQMEQDVSDIISEDARPFLADAYLYRVGPDINAAVAAERAGGVKADAVLEQALQEFQTWLRAMDIDNLKYFEKEIDTSYRLLAIAIEGAMDDAHKNCVEKSDIEQSLRLEKWIARYLFLPKTYAVNYEFYEAQRAECSHHFALQVKWKVSATEAMANLTLDGLSVVKVPIVLERGGAFTGTGSGKGKVTLHAEPGDGSCDGTTDFDLSIRVAGLLDSDAHTLNTRVSETQGTSNGSMTCTTPQGPITVAASSPGWSGDGDVSIPTQIGESWTLSTPAPGGSVESTVSLGANS